MKKKLFLIGVVLVLGWFHIRGWVPYDEGWFVQAANRIANGEKIYADFKFLYNPGGVILNQLAFGVFGQSVAATRTLALINSLLAVGLILAIGRKLELTPAEEMLAVAGYVFWGPGQINFGWPVMWCITAGLACSLLMMEKKYVWAGIAAGLIFVLKQNFGAAVILAGLIYLKKDAGKFLAGWGIVVLALAGYLWLNGRLTAYMSQMWYFTVERIFWGGALASPWPWEWPSPVMYKLVKTGAYLAPLMGAVWAIRNSRKSEGGFLPLLAVGFFVFSIRPTTDYIHLTPLAALTYPTALSAKSNRLVTIILGILLVLGIYKAVWGRYYRWNTPLINQNVWVSNPKIKLFTDQTAANSIAGLTKYFSENLTGEKDLFIYSFSPMWYFVLDKTNPTAYDYVHSGVTLPNDEKQIISDLEIKKTAVILTDHDIISDNTLISNFILTGFTPGFKVNEYTVWKR